MKKNNEKMNILVTGVGGDIGQSILKCLKEINYHSSLIGCDINEYSGGRSLADRFVLSPRASENMNYIKFIKEIIEENDINYIIPSTEDEIKVFNDHRDIFIEKNVKVLINNSVIIDIFSDKYKTVNFFEENNLPFPKTYLLSDYKNQFKPPFIAKYRESSGSKGVFVINDEKDLNSFECDPDNLLIQELVGDIDNEYTIGVFSDGNKTYHIAFKRYLGLEGFSKQVELISDDNIKKLADKISKLTNLKGSINVQARKVGDAYVPFEINPRISSTVYFRHYFGFKDVKWWIDIERGCEVEYSLKYKKGVGVRTLDEVFFELE